MRSLLDDIFGPENFENQIAIQTTTSATAKTLPHVHDYLLWYAKNREDLTFNRLFLPKEAGKTGSDPLSTYPPSRWFVSQNDKTMNALDWTPFQKGRVAS